MEEDEAHRDGRLNSHCILQVSQGVYKETNLRERNQRVVNVLLHELQEVPPVPHVATQLHSLTQRSEAEEAREQKKEHQWEDGAVEYEQVIKDNDFDVRGNDHFVLVFLGTQHDNCDILQMHNAQKVGNDLHPEEELADEEGLVHLLLILVR